MEPINQIVQPLVKTEAKRRKFSRKLDTSKKSRLQLDEMKKIVDVLWEHEDASPFKEPDSTNKSELKV